METLIAAGPAPDRVEQVSQFGQLKGLWNTDICYLDDTGGIARRAQGEWEFAYALEGRAVIDVWQIPRRDALGGSPRTPEQECGLCVRIWDRELQLWRFTFHSTASSLCIQMYARECGKDIIMERAEPGRLVRWVFFNIGPERFEWRNEVSVDGIDWRLVQTVEAIRPFLADHRGH